MEKKILSFHAPFKNIEINEAKRQIIVYETEEPEVITPTIGVSDGVSIKPASGTPVDLSKPLTYTLTGSDGTVATYTVIVCTVEWEYWELFSGGFSITGMGHFKEPWTAVSQNNVLTIHFGKTTESALDIYLNSPLQSSIVKSYPVGTFTPANIPAGQAGASFVYRENGVTKVYDKPLSGNLKITGYDAVNATISGELSQVKYTSQLAGSNTVMVNGKFKNLPIQMK
ncbi:MAG TPA: hypothetical protein PK971_13265 [Saprospiraceae bacterium]|nr:hypothetical protein [Saprospiraceae bacterium]HND89298.1 hypothetical protein [Saprospiraceae bacterium]